MLVLVVLGSFVVSFLFPFIGKWLDDSGLIQIIFLSLPFIGAPVLILSVLFGLAARCPKCHASYVTIVIVPPDVGVSKDLRDGVKQINSHIEVALGRRYVCPNCNHLWS